MSLSASIGRVRDRALGAARRLQPFTLLAIRVVAGVAFVQAGWGKLGHLDGVVRYFAELGIPAPEIQAPLVAGIELVGGALLIVGLATRVVAALLAGVMAVALATAIGPAAPGAGAIVASLEAAYLVLFVHLAAHGAGAVSLDHAAVRVLPNFAPQGAVR